MELAKKEVNVGGRPKTGDYTKKIMRFSWVEKSFKEIMGDFENENERKIAERVLNELRKRAI